MRYFLRKNPHGINDAFCDQFQLRRPIQLSPKMIKSPSNRLFLLGALALGLFAAQPAYAQFDFYGNYIAVGVNAGGSIISTDYGSGGPLNPLLDGTNPYLGIQWDPTGTSNFGGNGGHPAYNNDFITPGTPYQSYTLGYGGGYGIASYSSGTTLTIGGTVNTSSGSTFSTVTTGSYGVLGYTQTLSFNKASSIINFAVTLTNTSDAGIGDVVYATGFDPDPDVYGYEAHILAPPPSGDAYDTLNQIVSSSLVQAIGPISGNSIIIQDLSGKGNVIVDPSWDSNPYNVSAADTDGISGQIPGDIGAYQNGDYSIAAGWNFGDLAAGQSATFSYNYVINSTPVTSTGPVGIPGVPDSTSTWTLLAIGVAALIGFSLRSSRRALSR